MLCRAMPCCTVHAYVTPGSMDVKNGVMNPFYRFLHFALGISGTLPVYYIIMIHFKPLPPRTCDKEGHLKSMMLPSVSINMFFYKCIYLEGRLQYIPHIIFHMVQ